MPGGEYRDLGGAAAGAAEQAERDVGEQLDHAGALEERAEQDEQEDVGRRDVDRHAVEAFGAERQMGDDLIEIIAAMVERRRQILAEEPVEQTGAAHQRQRRAHQSARALEDQDGEQGADHEIDVGRVAVARDQVGVENPLVEAAEESGRADDPAQCAADLALGGEIRDQPETEQQQEADMDAAHHLARQHVPGGDHQLEHGERNARLRRPDSPSRPGPKPSGKPCSKLSNSTLMGCSAPCACCMRFAPRRCRRRL